MATTKVVTGKVLSADGTARANVLVRAKLSQAVTIPGTSEIVPLEVLATTAADGSYSFSLYSNGDLTPAGTWYTITEDAHSGDFFQFAVVVPQTAGPFQMSSLATVTPAAPPVSGHVSTLLVDGASTFSGPMSQGGVGIAATGEISALDPAYGAKGDGQWLSDAAITSGQAVVSSPTISTVLKNPPKIGQLVSFVGAGAAGKPLLTTVQSVNLAAGQMTLVANAQTTVAANGVVFFATDDTAALNAWISDLISKKAKGILPRQKYGYSGTLALTDELYIEGAGVTDLFGSIASGGNAAWFPTAAPYLGGTVLWQFAAAADAVSMPVVGKTVKLKDFGVLFANLFNGAGHGFNQTPSPTYLGALDTGVTYGEFDNLKVFGHDGNHYGFVVNNPLVNTYKNLQSIGGGALKIHGEGQNNYGNSEFAHFNGLVISGGTADAMNMTASAKSKLNLLVFLRPAFAVFNPAALPGNVAPSNAQAIWNSDGNTTQVVTIGEDLESNCGSAVTRPGTLWQLGSYGGGADVQLQGQAAATIVFRIYCDSGQTANIMEVHNKNLQTAFWIAAAGTVGYLKDLLRSQHSVNLNGGTVNVDPTTGEQQLCALSASTTIQIPNGAAGQEMILEITHDGTATVYTLTWPANVKLAGGAFGTNKGGTNAANSKDVLVIANDGTNWVEKSRAMNLS